ncbi:MAG: MBL fold metallo-hydrolase [Oscillospiraceae bacterium]|nr:MBL fold metallo-hydrolase [Oscillospiraceae bacterium]MBR2890191.1 MBL fold metallo-hydrolase [Oscillospiraceae bacterium]
MVVRYIHHSCFLVETDDCYYLFDYEKGQLPELDGNKPIIVLSSHGHGDHYNPEIFPLLERAGMKRIRAVLSDDIPVPRNVDALQVSPGMGYDLGCGQRLNAFRSTDLGVAFLIEDHDKLIYHAGDLNDWVWEEESDDYNEQMTIHYREQIQLLSDAVHGREIDLAFVVLDPRQEKDYDRGLCYFLERLSAKQVYPMHYWDDPSIIDAFLKDHPEYEPQIQNTESILQR